MTLKSLGTIPHEFVCDFPAGFRLVVCGRGWGIGFAIHPFMAEREWRVRILLGRRHWVLLVRFRAEEEGR